MSAFTMADAEHIMAVDMPAFVRDLGITVTSVEQDKATVRMSAGPQARRVGDIVSGQALSALADTAMVFAMFAAIGKQSPMATVDLHVTFLRAAGPGDVMAEAEVVRKGRSLGFAKVSMWSGDAPAKLVATAIGTFALQS